MHTLRGRLFYTVPLLTGIWAIGNAFSLFIEAVQGIILQASGMRHLWPARMYRLATRASSVNSASVEPKDWMLPSHKSHPCRTAKTKPMQGEFRVIVKGSAFYTRCKRPDNKHNNKSKHGWRSSLDAPVAFAVVTTAPNEFYSSPQNTREECRAILLRITHSFLAHRYCDVVWISPNTVEMK